MKFKKCVTNPELLGRWIEALRSGKYQQASGRLRREDKFCCLGVLCDVNDPSGWRLEGGNQFYTCNGESHTGVPGVDLLDAVGLDPNSCINGNDELQLTILNDSLGYSFNQIANLLESELREKTDEV